MLRCLLSCVLLLSTVAAAGPAKITVVIGDQAPALEKAAADQLSHDLGSLFGAAVEVHTTPPTDGSSAILVGSPATNKAIPADAWPKLSEQGHVLRSTAKGLVVGGSTPPATFWAAGELAYHFGIRHLLQGDVLPIDKPALALGEIDQVFEPAATIRAWSAFGDEAHSAASWPIEEHQRVIAQLAKLKFTHLVLPAKKPAFPAISVDGDIGGRAAFKSAKSFQPPGGADVLDQVEKYASEHGLTVTREIPASAIRLAAGAKVPSVLPQFTLVALAADFQKLCASNRTAFVTTVVLVGDLNPAVHYLSRASFDPKITAEESVNQLVTPICGEGVSSRLWKGFQQIEQASALISTNDASLGVPDSRMFLRHLESKDAAPAWLTEAKNLYVGAMNEMYRGNTRARGGARPFILYHAKRLEFAMQFCASVEALKNASHARTGGDADASAAAMEQAVEALYNGLNAHADIARDATDRGVIALLNEYGYRPLVKALDAQ